MRLSGILPETTKIIRDGTFSSLGTLFSRQPDHVVYATRDSDVAKIRENPSITCVITTPALASAISPNIGTVVDPDPRHAFFILQAALVNNHEFVLKPFPRRIAPSAKIHPSAVLPASSVSLGKDVIIEKNVVIHEQTIIEEGSIVRSNSIIGSVPAISTDATENILIQPAGGVYLHRDVDIHANTNISRSIFKGYTELGEQTKIDNLDTIGQGTTIGKRCLICAGVTIGEEADIGNDAWIGPNVILEDQIRIGNNVYITLGSRVCQDIADDKVVKDNFAIDRKRFKKIIRGM
ncbi:MAG: DapH/DapD/GlmU-related protein [Methanoregula sp.]|jgi:UDP-3-O-[3-hydroxymyristoyl] glucosamine N-acyltransferase